MNAIDLEPKYEQNLRRLAAYLLGDLVGAFEMNTIDDDSGVSGERTNCGSCGCAVGHAPYAGIAKQRGEDWSEFSARVFNLVEEQWAWCFSADWSDIDNSPEGAAKRILTMLENDLPTDWHRQLDDEAPLSYLDFEVTPEMLEVTT